MVAEQGYAPQAVDALVHLALDAGEDGITLGVVDQLQALVLIHGVGVNVVAHGVAVGTHREGGVAGQLAQREVDVAGGLAPQVGVATLVGAGGHVQAVGKQLFGRGQAVGLGVGRTQ